MNLESLIVSARDQGASDLHVEAGLPPALRIRGALRITGDPLPAQLIEQTARDLIGEGFWEAFLERKSADLSRTIKGVRCRINVLQTSRGVGLAIRLLASFQATLETLNLHPDLKRLTAFNHGLILVSGPTGSGKSSTLAALIQEINLAEARHIVTIESPIEYLFRPRRAFIRQREVGRDTPSFEQALLDALREDPDVVMVGEMREPQTMRLTLNASETGHLVLATVHSSSCAEALQRVVSAFPAEIQTNVAAQLADCLVGVITQRLVFRPDLNIRLPECEILLSTNAVKNFIRNRDFFKIMSSLETGADHGLWTFERYRGWMQRRSTWLTPGAHGEFADPDAPTDPAPPPLSATPAQKRPPLAGSKTLARSELRPSKPEGRIEIQPVEGGLDALLKKLD